MALQGAFAQWGRHKAETLTAAASRWRSERQAKKAARRGKPDVVIDLRLAWQIAAGEQPQTADIDRCHWLAKACERSEMKYLLLSSDLVFAGHSSRNIRETDAPDACTEPGFQMLEVENRVFQAAPSAIVLRTGPLFAANQLNMLTTVLDAVSNRRQAFFDERNIFAPVASIDAARVVAAILDQLSVGADAEGAYHYCSGDRTTMYGFAEAALAAASQFSDCGDALIQPLEQSDPDIPHDGMPPEVRVLDCSRLRDTFAIKQVPWRGFINPIVKQYFDQLYDDSSDRRELNSRQ